MVTLHFLTANSTRNTGSTVVALLLLLLLESELMNALLDIFKILEKTLDFPKYFQRYCFAGSKARWTLPYITTFTLHMFSYNSVIDGIAPKKP
jgi:hypothetical protein